MGSRNCREAYLIQELGSGWGEQSAQLFPCCAQWIQAVAESDRCWECPSIQKVGGELSKAPPSWETSVLLTQARKRPCCMDVGLGMAARPALAFL